jgi:uncharacterized metal-binding protein
MPDARGHDLITVLTGALMVTPVYASLVVSNPESAALNTAVCIGAHLISGMMFSPDLDLDSAIDDRWGVFSWIWWPYMQIIPHRHFWSHGLIVPPLLRLGYFMAFLIVILFGVARLLAEIGIVVPYYHLLLADAVRSAMADDPERTSLFLVGFITGGAVHSIADWLVTGGKRYLAMVGFRAGRSYSNHDRSVHRRGWYD